jgi:hypothetical protein
MPQSLFFFFFSSFFSPHVQVSVIATATDAFRREETKGK